MKAKAKMQAPVRPPLPPMPLSEKLRAIRAEEEAANRALHASGEFFMDDTPAAAEWKRLLHERIAFEESFFVYQGQEIQTQRVAYQSGDLTTNSLGIREGDEELFRDEAGCYYLRRKWSREDVARVHRLSLTAAVLWAIARANPETNALRLDAARAFSTAKEAA